MLTLLHEKDSGECDADDQEKAPNWESFVSKEELSSEKEIEKAPGFSATSDATTLPITSKSDQSPVIYGFNHILGESEKNL